MKLRSVFFVMMGALASVAGVAYAATTQQTGTAETPVGVIIAVAMSGLSQLGSTAFLIKKYMSRVDKDAETIPTLVATLEANKLAMTTIAANQTELFNSRNKHEKEIAEINMMHDLLECRKQIQRSGVDRRKGGQS